MDFPNLLALDFNFTTAEGIFTYVAVIASALAVLITLFSFIFDSDGADGMDGEAGAFSLRSVIGFFLGFGWAGLISLDSGLPLTAAIAIGVATGLAFFFIIAAMMRFIHSLRSDGTLDYSTLVGLKAVVYVTIPANREPGGQVRVAHPSQLLYLPAIQTGDIPLSANTPVVITEVLSGILTVKPY